MTGVLQDRVAIVTGAARGIGAGIARAFVAEGARVAVVDVHPRRTGETTDALVAAGGEAAAYLCDIRDTVQVDATVAAVVERWGGVDVLVNNAIAATNSVAFEHIEDAHVDQAYETGPRATIAFMRACFPHLRDSPGGGRVINLRSGAEVQGLDGFGSYIAAKAAIGGLTRAAAKEWGRHGITVNALAPYVLSDSAIAFLDQDPAEKARLEGQLAVKRYGDAEADVGRAAVYLAGPDSGYVTGCTVNVNGGVNLFA